MTTRPSTESPRNSSRSLVGSPPFSYAYERWVSARTRRAGSRVYPSRPSRTRVGRGFVRHGLLRACSSGVDDVEDTGACHLPIRPRGPDGGCRCRSSGTRCAGASARGSARTPPGSRAQPSTANGGGACCCATSSASEQPRLLLLVLVGAVSGTVPLRRILGRVPARPPNGCRWPRGGGPGRPRAVPRIRSTGPGSPPGTPAACGSASTTASRSTGSRSNSSSSSSSTSSSSASSPASSLRAVRVSASG